MTQKELIELFVKAFNYEALSIVSGFGSEPHPQRQSTMLTEFLTTVKVAIKDKDMPDILEDQSEETVKSIINAIAVADMNKEKPAKSIQ